MASRRRSQRRHTKEASKRSASQWRRIIYALIARRTKHKKVPLEYLVSSFRAYLNTRAGYSGHLTRTQTISSSQHTFNFNALTDFDCALNFCIAKQDKGRLADVFTWESRQSHTQRNMYSIKQLSSAFVLITLMKTRVVGELRFGTHAWQIIDIFWEDMETFLEARLSLPTSALFADYLSRKFEQLTKHGSRSSIRSATSKRVPIHPATLKRPNSIQKSPFQTENEEWRTRSKGARAPCHWVLRGWDREPPLSFSRAFFSWQGRVKKVCTPAKTALLCTAAKPRFDTPEILRFVSLFHPLGTQKIPLEVLKAKEAKGAMIERANIGDGVESDDNYTD